MLKAKNRLLALLLSLAMLFSTLPAAALAVEVEPEADVVTEEVVDDETAAEEETEEVASEEVTEEPAAEEETEEVASEEVTEEAVEETAAEDGISVASEDDISVASTTTGTKPDDGTTTGQPFSSGTGGSTYFRIPAMVTLDDGTIVAAADARWDGSSDGYGLDTIVSRSTDGGETWSYTFANYLGDNGNALNSSSTAFIDPCLATDGETVYMLVDLYPGGTVISNAQAGTGYDSDGHLMLKASGSSSYDYYLGDFDSDGYAYIYNYESGEYVGGYTVDQWFNVYVQGDLESNLFYSDCTYTVLPTSYLYLTTSTDGGETWSAPTMLNSQVKNSTDCFYGVGPGSALVTSTGRIIYACYTYSNGTDGNTSVIYSDDGGKTWTRSADMSDQSSEATMVEADGTIYMFTRHGGYYYSTDNGTTWSSKQTVSGISYTTSCQINAMVYSEKIDGCTAILLSAPTSNRTTGKIFVGLVQDDGSINWAYTYSVNGSNTYQYSCLAELSDGTVALLYESGSAAITYTTLDIADIAEGATIGNETIVTDEATGISATADGLTSISVTKGNAATNDDGSVSIAYGITLNGGDYTGAATVTIPVDEAFADCDSFSAVVYNDDASNADDVGVTVSGSDLILSVPHFSTVLVTGTTSGTTTVENTQDVTVYVGYTTTITNETGNYESVYNASGLDTDIASVTVTGTTTEASSTTTYSGTKVTSATSGSTYYVGNGTNYLVLSGSTLSTTTDITQATAFTWTEGTSYGQTTRYLSSGNYYLRYSSSTWSATNSTSNRTTFSSYSGSLTTSGGMFSSGTDTGYSLYTMTESTETVEGVEATTIAITGVAVGTTSVVVGNTQYNITVLEAPTEFTGTVSVTAGNSTSVSMSDLNSSYSLSDGQYVEWTVTDSSIADIYATSDTGASIIGHTAGTTTVTATVYDEDGTVDATYTWTVTVTGTSNSGSNTYSIHADVTVTNGRLYYSLNGGTVTEATLVSETVDDNGNTIRVYDITTTLSGVDKSLTCFFVAPDEGYALVSISDDGSTYGQYYVLDEETYDVTYSSTHTGGKPTDVLTDAEEEAMIAQAVALGCKVIYWNNRTGGSSLDVDYYNYCNKLPTVSKVITSVTHDGTTTDYVEGETEITVGDTITYTVSVTSYYENVNITYSNMTLTDTMSTGADGTPSWTSQTVSVTSMNNTTQTTQTATAASYTVTYTVQQDDVDSNIVNTVSLSYNYYTNYQEGTYGGSDSADCAVTIVSFYPDDIVVDFGLPVTIDYSSNHGTYDLVSGSALYGDVTVDNNKITYTPNTVLMGVDTVTVTNTKGVEYTFSVYPATTVYYEEGFATYGTGWSVTSGGGWSAPANKGSSYQETEIANTANNSYNNYNYDDAYKNSTQGSEGTAASTATAKDSLTFTFTGTGVDLFANCDSTSGTVSIMVKNSGGSTEKMLTVDMADIGSYASGSTAYNTPIASISELAYGEHTVIIYLAKVNETGFKFDGFRVYGTISDEDETTQAVYTTDLEENPSYYELRNNVLAGLEVDTTASDYKDTLANEVTAALAQVYATGDTTGAIVTYDTSSNVLKTTDVQDLLDDGPKNELYLDNGASVVFKINTDREVQIGLRSVTGASVTYTISDGTTTNTYTTSSSVDMFYTLQAKDTGEKTYTISVTSGGILSITDIKVCDSTGESIFGSLTADEVVAALTGETAEAETADAALTVNLVDYTGSVIASTQLTATGAAGESVTFASDDILSAVNEALPDGYALVDEGSVTDQTVACGDSDTVTVQIGKVATLTVTYQKYSGLFKKTTVGTVTLTKVQTSSSSKATFSASEIKAAVPSGYTVLLTTSASVSYGSTATKTVTVY